MSTLIITDPVFLRHQVPEGHPERPERLTTIASVLAKPPFNTLKLMPAPETLAQEALLIHSEAMVQQLFAASPDVGMVALDGDTVLCPHSLDCALRGLGAIGLAVGQVMDGHARNAFVAARPPGHHAERETAMGFCLFNTVAYGARVLQRDFGLKKVAIIDFDVHHGNGTQDIFWHDPSIFYASLHESPLYPGTGHANERGAHGNILNCPLPPESDGEAAIAAFRQRIMPALRAFKPEFILISAGFDAHALDPLSTLQWQTGDYAELTREILMLADELCAGRVVSTLEGGYNLDALALCTATHLDVMTSMPYTAQHKRAAN